MHQQRVAIKRGDRGSTAIEFAILLPVLLTVLLGIIDFGYGFFVQGMVAGAAREGVRDFAIHNNWNDAKAVALGMIPASVPATVDSPALAVCQPGKVASMTIRYQVGSLTGWFDWLLDGWQPTGKAEMRCGG